VMMEITDKGDRKYRSGKADWDEAHIPGSAFVDLLRDLGPRHHPGVPLMTPLVDFAAAMESCGIGNDHQVVLYDRSNHAWAACIWWMLRVCGHDSVVLHGGWQKWTAEKRPVSAEPTTYPRSSFTVRDRPPLMATKQRVLESISDGKSVIINALSADEHSGRVIRYPRAGRIAGSVNVDCELLVVPVTHTFLPADQLRMIFDSVGALSRDSAITYCGGGVASSLDALALTLLGMPNIAVYAGSLAEWTADPELPMEVG
jgi:thiosulfate/3-mercaptopyruvate sulfurtransferase